MKANEIKTGMRVEGGEGDGYDTGVVRSIDGDVAHIYWDSGVCTPTPIADLRPTTARHSDGHLVETR